MLWTPSARATVDARAGSTVVASVLVPSVQVNVSGSFSGSLEPAADNVTAAGDPGTPWGATGSALATAFGERFREYTSAVSEISDGSRFTIPPTTRNRLP